MTDSVPSRMTINVGNEPTIVVGWPLRGDNAYFEFFSLDEVNSTLGSIRLSLFFAGIITTGFGVLLGVFAARRAVRPVRVAAQAAKAIAGGRLDTRLEPTDDPDLSVLANSFNDMASALQLRIERDARFASDVSHELRSPLMTLAASIEVMEGRRDEMPERAQAALDLLSGDVTRFQGLVEDLLEISRFDAGAIRLHLEELHVAEFVRHAVAVSSLPGTPVTVTERAEQVLIRGDRRRLARVVANLIDNARSHGGGEPEVSIAEIDAEDAPVTHVQIAVVRPRRRHPGRRARSGVRAIRPRWRRRAPHAGATVPASAWRWSTSTSGCTAVGSGSRTAPMANRAPASSSSCRADGGADETEAREPATPTEFADEPSLRGEPAASCSRPSLAASADVASRPTRRRATSPADRART